jgi:hypothetical protein
MSTNPNANPKATHCASIPDHWGARAIEVIAMPAHPVPGLRRPNPPLVMLAMLSGMAMVGLNTTRARELAALLNQVADELDAADAQQAAA